MFSARAGGEIRRSNILSLVTVQGRSNINEVKEFTSFTVMYVPVRNWIDHQH